MDIWQDIAEDGRERIVSKTFSVDKGEDASIICSMSTIGITASALYVSLFLLLIVSVKEF